MKQKSCSNYYLGVPLFIYAYFLLRHCIAHVAPAECQGLQAHYERDETTHRLKGEPMANDDPGHDLMAPDVAGRSPISSLIYEIGRAAEASWARTARMTVLLAVAAALITMLIWVTSRY